MNRRERTLLVVGSAGWAAPYWGTSSPASKAPGGAWPASRCAPARELIEEHYPSTPEWLATGDAETLEEYRKRGRNAAAQLGTADRGAVGRILKARLGGSRRAGR